MLLTTIWLAKCENPIWLILFEFHLHLLSAPSLAVEFVFHNSEWGKKDLKKLKTMHWFKNPSWCPAPVIHSNIIQEKPKLAMCQGDHHYKPSILPGKLVIWQQTITNQKFNQIPRKHLLVEGCTIFQQVKWTRRNSDFCQAHAPHWLADPCQDQLVHKHTMTVKTHSPLWTQLSLTRRHEEHIVWSKLMCRASRTLTVRHIS